MFVFIDSKNYIYIYITTDDDIILKPALHIAH